MALEIEPNSAVEKAKWHNRKDEAYGSLSLSLKLESLFGKKDDLIRGHQLENELIIETK